MRGNLVGTDLMPELFQRTAGRGYKMFLLGATEESISEAAEYCKLNFPGWEVVGYHHGYVHDNDSRQAVIAQINTSGADALLVGMGNPLQEQWIHDNLSALQIPVCVGVGGLFNHWAGDINRAPTWVRRLGIEWLQILLQQPHKWRRYLLGNFSFVYRMRKKLQSDLAAMRS